MSRPILPCPHCGDAKVVVGQRADGRDQYGCPPCRRVAKRKWSDRQRAEREKPLGGLVGDLAKKRVFIEAHRLDRWYVGLETPWSTLREAAALLGRAS